MGLLRLVLLILFVLAAGHALTISQDTITNNATLDVDDLLINLNVFWSVFNVGSAEFNGHLDVLSGGGLYLTGQPQAAAVYVGFGGLSITNEGTISFDSRDSITSSSFGIRTIDFDNTGEIFGISVGNSIHEFISYGSFDNLGFLAFYQSVLPTSKSYRFTGVHLGLELGSISNNGDICIYNQVYFQATQIIGNGCFHIQDKSIAYLLFSYLPISTGQIFYMEGTGAQIIVEANTVPQPFTVAGFGNGNIISLNVASVNSYDYDSTTGTLTLDGGSATIGFQIGTGYDINLFKIITTDVIQTQSYYLNSTGNNSITYEGSVPNPGLPSNCRPCSPIPNAPSLISITPSVSSTVPVSSVAPSVSSVASTSSVQTRSSTSSPGVESVSSAQSASSVTSVPSTQSPSSLVSSLSSPISVSSKLPVSSVVPSISSVVPSFSVVSSLSGVSRVSSAVSGVLPSSKVGSQTSGCSDCTEFTTTLTTIGLNGVTTTETMIVFVTTDSVGSLYTASTLVGSGKCPVCTRYLSTVTATNTEGVAVTETCQIIVTTNAQGVPVTTTIGGVVTQYTTLCVQTLSRGVLAVTSGNIVVGTNNLGKTYTTTIIIGTSTSVVGVASEYSTTYVAAENTSPTAIGVVVVESTEAPAVVVQTTLPTSRLATSTGIPSIAIANVANQINTKSFFALIATMIAILLF